jgi:hypothetical protein
MLHASCKDARTHTTHHTPTHNGAATTRCVVQSRPASASCHAHAAHCCLLADCRRCRPRVQQESQASRRHARQRAAAPGHLRAQVRLHALGCRGGSHRLMVLLRTDALVAAAHTAAGHADRGPPQQPQLVACAHQAQAALLCGAGCCWTTLTRRRRCALRPPPVAARALAAPVVAAHPAAVVAGRLRPLAG